MTVATTHNTLCGSLEQKFDPLIQPLIDAKRTYRAVVRDLTNGLASVVWSPQSAIDAALADIRNSTNAILPGAANEDMEYIKDFLAACDFAGISSPAQTVLGSANGIYDKVATFINSFSITVPEFGLGALADGLNDLLAGAAFPGGNILSDIFKQADKLLQCMSTLCPEYDIGAKLAQLADLFDAYTLIDDPLDPNYAKVDYSYIYSQVGLTPERITAMNSVIDGIASVKVEAATSIDNAVAKVKSLTKIGGFF